MSAPEPVRVTPNLANNPAKSEKLTLPLGAILLAMSNYRVPKPKKISQQLEINLQTLQGAMNIAELCENNFGQPGKTRPKWFYLSTPYRHSVHQLKPIPRKKFDWN